MNINVRRIILFFGFFGLMTSFKQITPSQPVDATTDRSCKQITPSQPVDATTDRSCFSCCRPRKKVKKDRLVGTWFGQSFRIASPDPRPFIVTFAADGTMTLFSGSVIVPLGFDDRSGFLGQWQFKFKNGNERHYNFQLEEFFYTDGFVAGRFLAAVEDMVLVLNDKKEPCQDTGSFIFRFRLTRFIYEDNDPLLPIIDEITLIEDLVGVSTGATFVRFLTDPFYAEAGVTIQNICAPC